ncbi:response regulator transcription factor [Mesoterricola silvestris]|uniref:DNA-binding response regulator n=1 Tax=Mesoterricola silvestris TaxID=2927979 RepID=A0AA48GUG2_9BACT|nr:response regulator transcription factor [Mesoterricola silvestris]BDU74580.1 DNA-binding response regulator [Mesoterricola silvestris]
MNEPKILLVEDELSLAEGIKLNLELEGLPCTWVTRGDDALKRILAGQYELVILDVMLPGMDGFTVCQKVREAKNYTPILFLTAKNTEDDRVRGFETGGDDYLGKPFQVTELLLRIRAILRREDWYRNRSLGGRQRFGEFWVDFENFCGEGPQGPFVLGVKECMILKLLMEQSGQVVSRTDILDKVWGEETYPTTRTVDNFIVRIRRAMERDPHAPRWVHTVRSVGYLFDPEGTPRRGEE